MSMIIATFEDGELMPSNADAFFRYHDQEFTEVDSDGDVEGPVGYFTLRRVDRDDIAAYVSEHGDPWASITRNLAPGWYIDARGEGGAIWAFYYGGYCAAHDDVEGTLPEEAARRNFAEAQRVHNQWYADVEDDNELFHRVTDYPIDYDRARGE